MPRYVILRHEVPVGSARPSHWDFMLEHGDVLRTWALEHSPDDAEPQPALLLPDHRATYLTYEGPVSGNRGDVTRWDEGTFTTSIAEASDLAGDRVEIELAGRRLRGRVTLVKQFGVVTPGDAPSADVTFDYRYRFGG